MQHRYRSEGDTIEARSVTGNDECYAEATGHPRDDALRQSASISRTFALRARRDTGTRGSSFGRAFCSE